MDKRQRASIKATQIKTNKVSHFNCLDFPSLLGLVVDIEKIKSKLKLIKVADEPTNDGGGSRMCERVVLRHSGARRAPENRETSGFPAFSSLNKAQAHWPQSVHVSLRAVFSSTCESIKKTKNAFSYDRVYYGGESFISAGKRGGSFEPLDSPPPTTYHVYQKSGFMARNSTATEDILYKYTIDEIRLRLISDLQDNYKLLVNVRS